MHDRTRRALDVLARGLLVYALATVFFHLCGPAWYRILLPVVKAEFLAVKPKYENLKLDIPKETRNPVLVLTARVNVPVIREGKPFPYLDVRQTYTLEDLGIPAIVALTVFAALPMAGRARIRSGILLASILVGLTLVEIPSKFLHHTYISGSVDRAMSWFSVWYWDYFGITGGRQVLGLLLALAVWFPFRPEKSGLSASS
ncbi:MAG: hypothetical protein EOM25_12790 [Deltaproteobacteria bacterium]|nr:hypothetical protein [Deltaproteobacteria bacterium]